MLWGPGGRCRRHRHYQGGGDHSRDGDQHRHRHRHRDRPPTSNNTATTISTVDPAADVGVLMVASPEPVLVCGDVDLYGDG